MANLNLRAIFYDKLGYCFFMTCTWLRGKEKPAPQQKNKLQVSTISLRREENVRSFIFMLLPSICERQYNGQQTEQQQESFGASSIHQEGNQLTGFFE